MYKEKSSTFATHTFKVTKLTIVHLKNIRVCYAPEIFQVTYGDKMFPIIAHRQPVVLPTISIYILSRSWEVCMNGFNSDFDKNPTQIHMEDNIHYVNMCVYSISF